MCHKLDTNVVGCLRSLWWSLIRLSAFFRRSSICPPVEPSAPDYQSFHAMHGQVWLSPFLPCPCSFFSISISSPQHRFELFGTLSQWFDLNMFSIITRFCRNKRTLEGMRRLRVLIVVLTNARRSFRVRKAVCLAARTSISLLQDKIGYTVIV